MDYTVDYIGRTPLPQYHTNVLEVNIVFTEDAEGYEQQLSLLS